MKFFFFFFRGGSCCFTRASPLGQIRVFMQRLGASFLTEAAVAAAAGVGDSADARSSRVVIHKMEMFPVLSPLS